MKARIFEGDTWRSDRCTGAPYNPNGQSATSWQGLDIYTPGEGKRAVLQKTVGDWGDSGVEYVTKDYWRISCIASIPSGGEGFKATSPQGVTYYFDVLKTGRDKKVPERRDIVNPADVWTTSVILYASRMEDVNGNWVEFDYSDSSKAGPTRIHSNDGREITFSYDSTGLQITSATANGRSWNYVYTGWTLDEVDLPDGRSWEFTALRFLTDIFRDPSNDSDCALMLASDGALSTIKHPDGTVGTYSGKFQFVSLGTGVPVTTIYGTIQVSYESLNPCEGNPTGAWSGPPRSRFARTMPTRSVDRRELSVPGADTYVWTYAYEDFLNGEPNRPKATESFGGVSGPNVPLLRRTKIDPNGTKTVTYMIDQWGWGHGTVYKVEIFSDNLSTSPIQTTYSFPERNDIWSVGQALHTYNVNSSYAVVTSAVKKQVIVRGSDTFTTDYTYNIDIDSSGWSADQPVSVTRYSSLQSGTRTTLNEFESKKGPWTVGLPKSVTANGKLLDSFTYDDVGQVEEIRKFGSLYATLNYNADGTISSVDGAMSRTLTLSNYKRGKAQSVKLPNGTTLSRTVDNDGRITSVTDALGYTTSYSYHPDSGRLTLVDPPGSWSSTSISYGSQGNGLTQTITRGNLKTTTTYDGFIRPTLVKTEDLSGVPPTVYVNSQYDAFNRVTFASLPSTSSGETIGVVTTYDALGRTLEARENFAPFATTSWAYSGGNCVVSTDAENHDTTTCSSGYGSPSDGVPTQITHPEGLITQMEYDSWNNLQRVIQSGGGKSVTHEFRYDVRFRLCAQTTPETGSARFAYNDANEVVASASGINGVGCGNGPSGFPNYVTFQRDPNMGWLEGIDYEDELTPDVVFEHDPMGRATSATRGSSEWTYTYDSVGNLTQEQLSIDGRVYTTDYGYNADGHLSQYITPGGRTFTFAPDGFGRPTQARLNDTWSLAFGGRYHVSGALRLLNYGNGFQLTAAFNPRQQMIELDIRRDLGATTDLAIRNLYTYDKNGRVTDIDDRIALQKGERYYDYDGLGRLVEADGIFSWGQGSYTYDALGNLLTKQLGTRNVAMTYDPGTNRLISVDDSANAGGVRTFSYDSRGNVISAGDIDFVYDAANQPTEISAWTTIVGSTVSLGLGDYTASLSGDEDDGAPPSDYTVSGEVAVVSPLQDLDFKYLMTRALFSPGAGETYRVTAEVRTTGTVSVPPGQNPASIFFRELDGNYDYVGALGFQSVSFPLDSNWHEISTEYTADGTEVFLRAGLYRRPELQGSGTFEVRNLRVERIDDPNATPSRYEYDANFKRVRTSENGEIIYQVYSASGALLYRDNVTTGEKTDYVQMGGTTIARMDGTGSTSADVTWTYGDHLGSPTVAADYNNILWREILTPYGETWQRAAANDNQPAFTGHVRDLNTGLTYMQARYYDPVAGRFLSSDPVGFREAGWQYVNRYWYTAGDPINNIDPTGEACQAMGEGTMTCDPPGDDIGTYTIPQPEGSAPYQYMGPGEGEGDVRGMFSHVYNAEVSSPDGVGPEAAGAVASEVIARPTPGGNQNPATPEGALNDAGISPFGGPVGDNVRSYVTTDSNGNTIVANVTIPGQHMLDPGIVTQAIIPTANGVRIVVVGEGNGVISSIPGTNNVAGAVFQNKIQQDMTRATGGYRR